MENQQNKKRDNAMEAGLCLGCLCFIPILWFEIPCITVV